MENILNQIEQGFFVDLKTGLANYRLSPYRPSVVAQPTDEKFAAINQNGVSGPVLSRVDFKDRIEAILPFVL